MEIKKLIARIKITNDKSKKVLETLGFQFAYDKDYPGKKLSHYEIKLKSQTIFKNKIHGNVIKFLYSIFIYVQKS